MILEIHMSSQLGTSEILALASTAFSKIVVDPIALELLVQDY